MPPKRSSSPNPLQIVEIKPSHDMKHKKVKHPVLPQHEFSLLIVAAKGSGKTNLICNLLLNQYKGYFHRVIVCSPTVANDPKWERVKNTDRILCENKQLNKILGQQLERDGKRLGPLVHESERAALDKDAKKKTTDDGYDGRLPESDFISYMDEIKPLLQKQLDDIAKLVELGYKEEAKYLIDRVLVIEDDQAGMYKGGNNNNEQVNFTIKHRHYGTSLVKVTQAYKAIPKSIRTNMNALICFEIPNLAELEVIYEEWPMSMVREEWMRVFRHCTEDPFDFIYFNTHFPKGARVYHQFKEKIELHATDTA